LENDAILTMVWVLNYHFKNVDSIEIESFNLVGFLFIIEIVPNLTTRQHPIDVHVLKSMALVFSHFDYIEIHVLKSMTLVLSHFVVVSKTWGKQCWPLKHDDTRQLKQRTKTINKMKAHKRKQESFEEKVMGGK